MSIPTYKTHLQNFQSTASALDYMEGLVTQRFTLPIKDISANAKGYISHGGSCPIGELSQVPLTDVALAQMSHLAKIPKPYADRVEPDLLAHSLNEIFKSQVAVVSLVVEHERGQPESKRVKAVLLGAGDGIEDSIILNYLDKRHINASVKLQSGYMEALFGDTSMIDVLPNDSVRTAGFLYNFHWQRNFL